MTDQLLVLNRDVARKYSKLFCLIILCLAMHPLAAQNISVSGKVTDESGPLPGATVMVQGTTNGVVTDIEGNYTLTNVSPEAILEVSYLGFATKEVSVNGKSVINVTLEEDLQQLQEVVVIGYGVQQRKEAVTGSVASIGGKEMREVPSANITEALHGRLPGVQLTQTSSRPGAGRQIRIRGTRSLTASNDPLIVLDGIPFAGSINDIDPNSITSVDILKDASATAIYGARGANGVILVTTNRGRKGQEAQISYNFFHGMKKVFSQYPMMTGPELTRMREVAEQTVAETGGTNYYGPSTDEEEGVNTNWQDLLYRTAQIMSHDIGISKGSENGNYSFGLGYFQDQSVLPTNQYTRYTLRAAVDQEVGNYVRFGLSSNNSYGYEEGGQVGVAAALGASPLSSPYDEDGDLKLGTFASTQQDFYKVWTRDLIEDVRDRWLSETKTYGTYNNIYGEVEAPWVKGLKYRINLGLNHRRAKGGSFTGRGVLATREVELNNVSSASQSHSLTTSWVVENLLSYDKTFGKHHLNALVMHSNQEESYEYTRIAVQDLPSDHFQYHNLGFAEGEILINSNSGAWDGQKYRVWGLKSWMGRIIYSYDDKYLLTATLRSDGSSRLAPGNKWHTYPAVSAGWNIAKESFMSGVGQVDLLKLRVGYGETATQAISPYSTLGSLAARFYNFGEDETGYATGYLLSELPNPNLGWEYTQNWNLGVDFGLFRSRLSGTIEYYEQYTKDILLRVNLPATAGVGSFIENVGETENKGIELALNGLIIDNPNGFTLEAGVNLYANRNKLVALASGQQENEGNGWFVGHPINVIYDVKRVGLWQEEDPHRDILEPGGNVGMIKVEYTGEYNEDGTPVRAIGPDDRQIQDFNPDLQGGFNTRLGYKGLELTIVGAFRVGGTLISSLYGRSSYLNLLNGRHNNVSVDYWTPENTGAKYPRPGGAVANDNLRHANTLAYFNGSYTKIRTMTLGYNFSPSSSWMQKAGISRLRVYVTAQNPFVLFSPYHKETGMDPEPNSFGNENQAVTNDFQSRLPIVGTNVPTTRNYLVGLNLTF